MATSALVLLGVAGALPEPWWDRAQPPATRAKLLAAQMTLDEKLAMLHGPATGPCCQCDVATHGPGCAYVGNVIGNTRLGIPPLTMNDGPQGFRDDRHPGTTTAWPSGLTMAASWDAEAMYAWGKGMGREFKAKGSNVQLGPGLCLARIPRNGRNFEYLSGEDPYLGYTLVKPVINGIQSQQVIANAKHWALNNQETNRGAVDELASERTRFEMYYPPFAGAVEADVGSVMCSYNKINGNWSCENPTTLGGDLKARLGLNGFVMSDWGATHSTSLAAGLDVEMPAAKYMGPDAIQAAIASGGASVSQVNDSVVRILTPMFSVGVMDAPKGTWNASKLKNNVTNDESLSLVRKLAALSTVLLQNNGVLPLASGDAANGRTIAVIGFAADNNTVVHAGGSGSVVPSAIVSPLSGITAAAGKGATVKYDDGSDPQKAAALAAAADDVVVFVQTLSSEGSDRPSLSIDDGCKGQCGAQNALVDAVAAASNRTVVVMTVPGATLTPWRSAVGAILVNFMPGQQAGNAIADVLFGSLNPSAKLPLTFPATENDTAITPHQWPGWPNPRMPTYANYSEGLFVGYRYYDAHKIKPAFPFGHGLSYTTFEYKDLVIDSASKAVSITLSNTGKHPGAEVAQLYVSFPAKAGEPPNVLRRFQKVHLAAGESQKVSFEALDPLKDLAIWDETKHDWAAVSGTFTIHVGASSRDLRLSGTLDA